MLVSSKPEVQRMNFFFWVLKISKSVRAEGRRNTGRERGNSGSFESFDHQNRTFKKLDFWLWKPPTLLSEPPIKLLLSLNQQDIHEEDKKNSPLSLFPSSGGKGRIGNSHFSWHLFWGLWSLMVSPVDIIHPKTEWLWISLLSMIKECKKFNYRRSCKVILVLSETDWIELE